MLRDCGLSARDVRLEVDGVQPRVLAARVGLGVLGTFFPPYAGDRPYGELVPLAVERELPTVEVGLVSPAGGPPSVSAEAFADLLRAVAAGLPVSG